MTSGLTPVSGRINEKCELIENKTVNFIKNCLPSKGRKSEDTGLIRLVFFYPLGFLFKVTVTPLKGLDKVKIKPF